MKIFDRKYARYLNSTHWKKKRQEVFEAKGKFCNACQSIENLQVHHLTYANLNNEKLEDLEVLCDSCHEKRHEEALYTQIYSESWSSLINISKENNKTLILLFTMLKHMDNDGGLVQISKADLARKLQLSTKTIGRYAKYLIEKKWISQIQISSDIFFTINPDFAWKNTKKSKGNADYHKKDFKISMKEISGSEEMVVLYKTRRKLLTKKKKTEETFPTKM